MYQTQSFLENKQKAMKPIDILVFIFITLYLLIDCFSLSNIQDQLGIHWLLLSGLNFISIIFILKYRKEIITFSTKNIFKNVITVLYLIFVIIAGISLLAAINRVEGVIIYSRLLTTFVTFFILTVMLYKRLYLFKNIAIVIAITVLIKSYSAISLFYSGLGKVGLDELIGSLKSSEGNKNIFAAVLVVQIPIIIYGFFVHKKWLKYLCAISLGFAFMAVFIINARAAYLGLLLQLSILVIGFVYLFYKEQEIKTLFSNLIVIVAVLAGGFLITQHSLSKAIQNDKTSVYGTFGDRLSTITDNSNSTTSIRLEYWEHALAVVKERPLLGVGYGNWKLYSTTYTNTLLNDNVFSKHPHNDFLEIAGETGIPNSVIYLLIFVVAFFITSKTLFSAGSPEKKMISLVVFVCLIGYFVDAFFNFPLERPHMQILFVFILALLITNYLSEREEIAEEENNIIGKIIFPIIVSLTILISAFGIYIHYTVLQSMKSQFIVDNDLNSVDGLPGALPHYKYAQVKKMFPAFPNIAENSETIGYKEAKYLRKEKRYDEAIHILDSVHNFSPNTAYDYYLKCNIYKEQGKIDSAYVYGKKAFYAKPRNFSYYRMASYYAAISKEPNEVIKMFNLYNTYRKEQQGYSYYAQCLNWSGYDVNKVKKVVDDGLKLYPKDLELLNLKATLPQ